MSLLDGWINSDLFSALRDKFNAVKDAVNVLGGGTTGQVLKKSSSADFDFAWINSGYNTTSTSSVSVDVSANKTFTVASGLDFKVGTRVRASKNGDSTIFIEGNVVSYSGTSLVITADCAKGSAFAVPTGSFVNDWIIGLGGSEALQVSSIDFSVVTFNGGSAPTVSSAKFDGSKLGGIFHMSFKIVYTGGSGDYTYIKVTPPAGFIPTKTWYGSAFQSLVYQTPLNVYITGSDIYISPSDGGAGIQSGSNTITGNITFPV